MVRFASLTVSLLIASLLGMAPPPAQPTPTPTPTEPPAAPPAPKPETAKRPKPKERVKEIKSVTGTIRTKGRAVSIELFVHKAPTLCANFAFLARQGFWDGKPWTGFTRVIRQTGANAVGYTLPREFAPDLTFDDPRGGNLCMAKVSDKVADSANAVRFFITIKNQERWNLDFQIFGRVTSGLDAIVALEEGDLVESITLEGDVDALLAAFEPETKEWAAALEELAKARQLPPGTLPGTPDRRTGEVPANRPIDGTLPSK
jgi:peptidyl-prolyl cis-trans isomerase B (cyclophilin B)